MPGDGFETVTRAFRTGSAREGHTNAMTTETTAPAARAVHASEAPSTLLTRPGGPPVVELAGDLDRDVLAGLATRLEALADRHDVVVLDAAAVTFADSDFLRLLVGMRRRTDLRVAAPSRVVSRLLRLTGVPAVVSAATLRERG